MHAQPTRADAEKDPVLKAMLVEMDRSMSHLQLPGFAKMLTSSQRGRSLAPARALSMLTSASRG
jgi:hypothetical protein